SREITASEEQVDDTLQEMAEANGMDSGDDFIAALAEQGMAEDEVMDQLKVQVEIEQLITEEAGDIEPTEAELQELYEQTAAQQEQAAGEGGEAEEMPAFEDVEDQLKEQVKAQKEGEATQALVDALRETADVTIHLCSARPRSSVPSGGPRWPPATSGARGRPHGPLGGTLPRRGVSLDPGSARAFQFQPWEPPRAPRRRSGRR